MTPAEALTVLDNAASQVPATRAQHVQIAQAVDVLRGVVAPEEPTGSE